MQPGELTIALEPAFSVPLGGGFAALVLAMARRKKVDVGANRMVAAPTVSLLGTVEERLRSCLEGVAALRAENERLRAWARNERKFDG